MRIVLLILAAFLVLITSGCDDGPDLTSEQHVSVADRTISPDQPLRLTNQVSPDTSAPILPTPSTSVPDAVPIAPSSDPLAEGGDALGQGGDRLAAKGAKPNDPNGQDPFAPHAHRTQNWYWLRGDISGGTVTVTINSVVVGDLASHVDREVTDFCYPGGNTILFTTNPSTPMEPVSAKLDLVYSQQEAGSPPVVTYDTSQPGVSDTMALAPPKPPSIDGSSAHQYTSDTKQYPFLAQ